MPENISDDKMTKEARFSFAELRGADIYKLNPRIGMRLRAAANGNYSDLLEHLETAITYANAGTQKQTHVYICPNGVFCNYGTARTRLM